VLTTRPPGNTVDEQREAIAELQDIIDGQIWDGSPTGEPNNSEGVWVVGMHTGTGAVTYAHNLDISTAGFAVDGLNVTWRIAGIKHSGAGTLDAISLEFQAGDTVNVDDIQLRARYGGRTVGAAPNDIMIAVFFQRAEGW
jgi:hypothetical protein